MFLDQVYIYLGFRPKKILHLLYDWQIEAKNFKLLPRTFVRAATKLPKSSSYKVPNILGLDPGAVTQLITGEISLAGVKYCFRYCVLNL